MQFKENSEQRLIAEYHPETSESETGKDFANLRPATIEGSQKLLLEHSETTMDVDFEGLSLCKTPHKNTLWGLALREIAIAFPHEEEIF